MNRDLFKLLRENHLGHYVLPEQLCVGLYVHLDLGWMEHPFALSNFKIKDEVQIRKIRALNLRKIRFDPLRSDVVPDFPETIQLHQAPVAPAPSEPVITPKPLMQSNRLKQLNDAILQERESSMLPRRKRRRLCGLFQITPSTRNRSLQISWESLPSRCLQKGTWLCR